MYTDLYLKFADEAEANSVLYTVHPETVDEDGVTVSEEYTTPNYQNIDVLGVIYVDQPIPDQRIHLHQSLKMAGTLMSVWSMARMLKP